jgi:hypothetical protein
MKRRRIALGFLLVAVALGAWLIFSGKPEGRVSVRFSGYDTNEANEVLVRLWITNGYDFPVLCMYPVGKYPAPAPGLAPLEKIASSIEKIGPHSDTYAHFFPEQSARISASPRQLAVRVSPAPRSTRTEVLRRESGMWLRNCGWHSLGRFVDPTRWETVLSEPIVFPPDEKGK